MHGGEANETSAGRGKSGDLNFSFIYTFLKTIKKKSVNIKLNTLSSVRALQRV